MNVKKVFLSILMAVVILVLVIPQAFAATNLNPPIILGITAKRPGGFGYSIGGAPYPRIDGSTSNASRLWDIIRYDSTSTSSGVHRDIDMFCLNAKYGFESEDGSVKYDRLTYDTKYNMKTEKNKIFEKSSREDLRKLASDRYNALLALGDLLYIKGQTETEKLALLNAAGINSEDYTYPLTDDDIWAVEQSVIWYFTNYEDLDDEGNHIYDKREQASDGGRLLLYYTTADESEPSPATYNSLAEYKQGDTYEGAMRAEQAGILYNYLIRKAEQNASNYSSDTLTGAPVTITAESKFVEKDSRYIIGPIKIEETSNKLPYTVGEFTVKNGKNVVTDYTFVKKEGDNYTTISKRGNDLVGQEFYISVPNNDIENISISADVNYTKTNLELWTHSTSNINQPILIPEKEPDSIPLRLNIIPESKPFDLALRKYITKVTSNGVTRVLSDSDDTTRVPRIEEGTLTSGTTATYKHRKNPVAIETGDIVTYNITIYNEGQKAGRATQIIDQLPTGLQFKRVVSGNFVDVQIDGGSNTNALYLNRKANNTDNLDAYSAGHLASETIEIECEVTATPDSKNQKILTNVAWINSAYDAVSETEVYNQQGLDRDSEPATHPDVDKDSMSNYKGKATNKPTLGDKDYHYEGEQDDDDFEKLVLEPETFDLKLIKNIVKINERPVTERLKGIDVSKLNVTSNAETTAEYDMDKNPISVAKGDIVTYRLRVYNEGTLDGYASEITEDIPEGLEFIFVPQDAEASDEEKAASDFNMENGWSYVDSTDEGLRKIKTTKLSLHPESNGIVDDNPHTDNLITAFGRNDGTKTANDLHYKDVFVKMKVVSDNVTGITIRNEACISKDSDKDGNEIDDRDSDPDEWVKYEDDEDFDNIILKPFDLALRKFIIAISEDETIQNSEYLKDSNGNYTRAPKVDTTKLNTMDSATGKLITTATYNHPKEPVEVKKGDIVVYMLRVYNEGDISGYATEIKDHLPSNLEYVDGEFNEQYGWSISEDGRTVTTSYLENQKIDAADDMSNWEAPTVNSNFDYQPYILSYKEVPIMCRVKNTAKVDEKITNIADITEFKDENKQTVVDRDSQEDNVNATEGNKPEYKDNEKGDYIPGQQDDDDFEKVIIPNFDLALRKQITSIYNSFNKKETKYNDRYAKLDNTQNNTIYNYYDVDSNIPTVVENDVVTYSIRIYNEGKVDGTATWVTDRLPSGLQYLPDDETNKEYGWKAYKQSTASSEKAVKIGEKYYEEVDFNSNDIYMYATEYLKDTTIKAYTGDGEATYGEVFMTTRVKAKSEVAEGTEFKLRNIAEIGDDNNDDDDSTPGDESKWKDQDDVDVEDLKLVEFDLALRKWVTQAIVYDKNGQTVTETGHQPYDDPEQVVKVELHRRKLNEVTVKFRYSIRIINEGDIAGYAKEITDYIPQGLKFVAEDNPGWTDEGNNVISTTLLENTLLQPGEFADVEVLLTWINSENNMGVMVNTAEISKDYNEYGVPDKDSTPDNKKPGEDDIDDAPVMLSISTGQMRIYFALGFVVLITIAGGVVLIKKYVL